MSIDRPAGGAGWRRTVATYDDYLQAQRAVDWLSDQGFPVENVSIVGSGLRSVERVTGRVTTGRAALTGAGQGAMIGLIFALLFGLFFTGPEFFGLLLYAVVAGAIFGAVLGALGHAALGGQRDFASTATRWWSRSRSPTGRPSCSAAWTRRPVPSLSPPQGTQSRATGVPS